MNRIEIDGSVPRWSVQRRLEFIDFRLFWDGKFNRSGLIENFGVSAAQASSDIALYEKLAPANLSYDRASKTYRRTVSFEPVLIGGTIERYLLQLVAVENQWMGLEDTWFDAVPPIEVVTLGRQRVEPVVLLRVLDAIREREELGIRYASLTGSPDEARSIVPHALFQCAGRWYVRSWSRDHDDFRDYNLHRILEISQRGPATIDPSLDFEWIHYINLVIVPNPDLSAERKAAVAAQYAMESGHRVRPCRLSQSFYLMAEHNLDVKQGLLKPQKQQLVLQNRDEVEGARTAARQMAKEALARARSGQTSRR